MVHEMHVEAKQWSWLCPFCNADLTDRIRQNKIVAVPILKGSALSKLVPLIECPGCHVIADDPKFSLSVSPA